MMKKTKIANQVAKDAMIKFHPNMKALVEEAGFILWQKEEWNPGDVVDWSCRYDIELVRFGELVVEMCATIARQDILKSSGLSGTFEGKVKTEDEIYKFFGMKGSK
jgi:hypothetical protein